VPLIPGLIAVSLTGRGRGAEAHPDARRQPDRNVASRTVAAHQKTSAAQGFARPRNTGSGPVALRPGQTLDYVVPYTGGGNASRTTARLTA
jgi:hypothetical protein